MVQDLGGLVNGTGGPDMGAPFLFVWVSMLRLGPAGGRLLVGGAVASDRTVELSVVRVADNLMSTLTYVCETLKASICRCGL